MDQAWELEAAYWASITTGETADLYRHTLSHDVTVVIPGHRLNREQLLHHFSGDVPRWVDYTISDRHTVFVPDALTVLTYRIAARGSVAGSVYTAQVSSAYTWTAAGWALTLRQHTPDPGVSVADWLPPSLVLQGSSTSSPDREPGQ